MQALWVLNLPNDVQTLSVSRVISGNDIDHLIYRLYFTIKAEENDTRKSYGYSLNDNVKFPFDL